MTKMIKASKYLCLILRHKPWAAGIELDEHGWADVAQLLEAIAPRYPLTMEQLEEIVDTDDKQRYSFSEDKTLIRANQGHSVPVDIEFDKLVPPEYLWHGTAERSVESIMSEGLRPMSRLYVHISADTETALKVGKRHGVPVILRIDALRMHEDGYEFFRSANGVWLARAVPPQYLSRWEG